MRALTPAAYAASTRAAAAGWRSASAAAIRARPSVRTNRSWGRPSGPRTSALRPWARRRVHSICASRSWAWTKPKASHASPALVARTWGTPRRSRTISTSASSPTTGSRPSTMGWLPRSVLWSPHHQARPSPTPTTPKTSAAAGRRVRRRLRAPSSPESGLPATDLPPPVGRTPPALRPDLLEPGGRVSDDGPTRCSPGGHAPGLGGQPTGKVREPGVAGTLRRAAGRARSRLLRTRMPSGTRPGGRQSPDREAGKAPRRRARPRREDRRVPEALARPQATSAPGRTAAERRGCQ